MPAFRFEPCELPPGAEALRAEVRAFLRETLGDYPPARRARSWMGFDPEFSLRADGWAAARGSNGAILSVAHDIS